MRKIFLMLLIAFCMPFLSFAQPNIEILDDNFIELKIYDGSHTMYPGKFVYTKIKYKNKVMMVYYVLPRQYSKHKEKKVFIAETVKSSLKSYQLIKKACKRVIEQKKIEKQELVHTISSEIGDPKLNYLNVGILSTSSQYHPGYQNNLALVFYTSNPAVPFSRGKRRLVLFLTPGQAQRFLKFLDNNMGQ